MLKRIVCASVAVALLGTISAQSSLAANKETVARQNEAVRLLSQRKFLDAIAILNQVIKENPSYDLARLNLSIALNNQALQYADLKNYKSAYSLFCKSLFLNSSNKTTQSNIETMISMMGKNPKTFADRIELGNSALKEHDAETAIVSFEAALKIKSDETIDNKLKSLLKTNPKPAAPRKTVDWGNYISHVQTWVKAVWNPPHLEHSTKVVAYWKVMADGTVSNLRLGTKSSHPEMDRAGLEAVRCAAPFHPLPRDSGEKDIDIQFTFDYNVWSKERKVELEKAASIDPSIKPATYRPLESEAGKLYLKGKECYATQDYDGAVECFTDALNKTNMELRGLPIILRGHLADALIKQSSNTVDPEEVVKKLRVAVVLEPDREELQSQLNLAIKKSGKDFDSFETRTQMADELFRIKEIDQALNEYKAAYKIKKDEAVQSRIVELSKIQKASETAKKWKFFLERVPNSVDGHLGLALALSEMSERDEALKEFDKVLQLDPRNPTALARRKTLEASQDKPESQ